MSDKFYTERFSNGFTFDMHLIPGGTFDMGSPNDDQEAYDSEQPQRLDVQVDAFYLAPFVVTQALWKAVMGETNNPS